MPLPGVTSRHRRKLQTALRRKLYTLGGQDGSSPDGSMLCAVSWTPHLPNGFLPQTAIHAFPMCISPVSSLSHFSSRVQFEIQIFSFPCVSKRNSGVVWRQTSFDSAARRLARREVSAAQPEPRCCTAAASQSACACLVFFGSTFGSDQL